MEIKDEPEHFCPACKLPIYISKLSGKYIPSCWCDEAKKYAKEKEKH